MSLTMSAAVKEVRLTRLLEMPMILFFLYALLMERFYEFNVSYNDNVARRGSW